MMSSTYEAVLEVATTDFRAYKVARCVDQVHKPRFHPSLYFVDLTISSLGAILRKVGLVGDDPQTSFFPKEETGWRVRPVFEWDSPEWEPTEDARQAALEALDATRQQLQGGWEGTLRAAKLAVRRMQRRRDGVATRQAVYHITAAKVGEVEAKVNQLEQKVDAQNEKINEKIDRMLEAQNQMLTILKSRRRHRG